MDVERPYDAWRERSAARKPAPVQSSYSSRGGRQNRRGWEGWGSKVRCRKAECFLCGLTQACLLPEVPPAQRIMGSEVIAWNARAGTVYATATY